MSDPNVNRQWLLANRPPGWPSESDFELVETPVPEPAEGQFLVRNLWVSVDPYMRGRMRDVKSYVPPTALGAVMGGESVARVTASRHPDYAEGEIVVGPFAWQDYALSDGQGARKVDPKLAPISTAVGALGMPGMTAYFGLLDVCGPKEGETVLVSGAAGAVGSLVGQIAKIKGCRAVGIAGSQQKVDWITGELGFDAAFNYKTVAAEDYSDAIGELCPDGVDCYFDNVGGPISDAVFPRYNVHGRMAICGQISLYNDEDQQPAPRPYWFILRQQLTVRGFLVFQFLKRYPEGLREMAQWIGEGSIKFRETVVEGLENTPAAFIGMMRGENIGKQLVRVAPQ
ncbi:MAG: NADP-dependent oxidoreductase [SAR324 cluster bacterium]|nr:NADP-dependent oxidoreductase [SAR324 cluster bacterium]